MTFAAHIETVADAEPIEAIVIGQVGYGADERHAPGNAAAGQLLTWEQARPLLDYDYDGGYGSADIPPVHAWTATRIILVGEYDGSTHLTSVPRHPIDDTPEYL